ncbi:MAG TPA: 4'-phosphopantetheinyl transferase superfamily protein [Actinocrinis sp.]|nr:4'-phosphopantetheinyl transferase superfamily protein [Actinocrinis sp.]
MTGPDPLIGRLLPAGVCAAESFGTPPPAELAGLYPAEEEAVSKAVDKRRREYAWVRHCARQALGGLGVAPGPILSGPRREPLWPEGVVGSMTHCDGYRAAAVASTDVLLGIGLDAEPHGPLPDGILDSITLPEERKHLDDLAGRMPQVHWQRLVFSAKESVYKAWFPQTGEWLGFHDASLLFTPAPEGPDQGVFTAQLLKSGLVLNGRPTAQLTGRWMVCRGLVITAVSLVATG